MRKILSFLLAAVMISALVVSAKAAESAVKMADVKIQEAEKVYIPVSLQTEITATAVGLTYTYDDAILQILPEECRWIPQSELSDFSHTGCEAVWATDGATKLSGELCVLAFRILNMQSFRETEVSCSIKVENGAAAVGTYQDTAKISKVCGHSFGEWQNNSEIDHIRACSLCQEKEVQSHDWDAGKESADPEKPNAMIITYTCKVCKAEKVIKKGGNQENPPADPKPENPSEPEESKPTEPKPQPTDPDEEDRKPDPKPSTPSSGSSGKPSGSSSGTTKPQSGTSQGNSWKPTDYNQQSKTKTDSLTRPEESNNQGNITAAQSETVEHMETHPMAIEAEEDAVISDEQNVSEATAEKDRNSPFPWVLVGIALAVSVIGVVLLFVIKKKQF